MNVRVEGIKEHRMMWHYLSENPLMSKRKYIEKRIMEDDFPDFDEKFIEILVFNACFLCAIGEKCCPLVWPDGCCSTDGLVLITPFDKWLDAETEEDRIKYAKIIRDLPEKEV